MSVRRRSRRRFLIASRSGRVYRLAGSFDCFCCPENFSVIRGNLFRFAHKSDGGAAGLDHIPDALHKPPKADQRRPATASMTDLDQPCSGQAPQRGPDLAVGQAALNRHIAGARPDHSVAGIDIGLGEMMHQPAQHLAISMGEMGKLRQMLQLIRRIQHRELVQMRWSRMSRRLIAHRACRGFHTPVRPLQRPEIGRKDTRSRKMDLAEGAASRYHRSCTCPIRDSLASLAASRVLHSISESLGRANDRGFYFSA